MITLLSALLALPTTIAPHEVRAGMKGECLTVFEGDRVEPFSFVVKGNMPNYLGPGRDLVLVRLLGDKPEFTGVVAGMSGSPCSIDGKLLGALGYAFAEFAKEPIAGITPIADMRKVMKLPAETRPWRLADADPNWESFREGKAVANAKPEPGAVRPIATPMTMGGVHPTVFKHFAPWFRSMGFEPVAGGASRGKAKAKRFKPGDPIAGVLVRGDVEIAGTGTVTWVDGDRVLAFGHPFLGAGAISIPMANASIVNTMASALRSFKMSLTGAIVGELTQDRLPAIGGYMGRKPQGIPVEGTVVTHGANNKKTKSRFALNVARDLALSPRFIAVGLSSAMTGRIEASERGLVRTKTTVTLNRDLGKVTLENTYAAQRDSNLLVQSGIQTAQAVSALWQHPFGSPPAVSIEFSAEHHSQPIQEWVDGLHVGEAVARPGSVANVGVRIKKWGGGERIEKFDVSIPNSWRGEELILLAGGAAMMNGLQSVLDGQVQPTSLKQIVGHLQRYRGEGNLYVVVARRTVGLRGLSRNLGSVPPSVAAVFSGDSTVDVGIGDVVWEAQRNAPGVIYGSKEREIQVANN